MKDIFIVFIIIIIFLPVPGCNDSLSQKLAEEDRVVYHNSFETDKDTTGWSSLTPDMFVDEAAPGNGTKSLHIGGGCLQPAAFLKLKDNFGSKYKITCWGKKGNQGGFLTLSLSDSGYNSEKSGIGIGSREWKYYESAEQFTCPKRTCNAAEHFCGWNHTR